MRALRYGRVCGAASALKDLSPYAGYIHVESQRVRYYVVYRSDAREQYANDPAFLRMLDDPSPNVMPCIIADPTMDPSPIILATLIINVTDGGVA